MNFESASDILAASLRPLAQHCPELLRPAPHPAELLPVLGQVGTRLARRLGETLAPLLGGPALVVRASAPREGTLSAIRDAAMSPLAANSLMALGESRVAMLLQFDAEPVLRMVDRAFGGKGEAPGPLPKAFTPAAEMMIGRLERLLADHLLAAIEAITQDSVAGAASAAIESVRRNGNLAELEPFAEDLPLCIVPFEIEDGGIFPWAITLALPLAALPELLGAADLARLAAAPRPQMSPTAAPFADLPLTLRAVIVDMAVPFSTAARLAPGMVLPVSVARSVPLSVGDAVFAHGQVGAVDDRVALQITQAFDI
jgi:flagellar motor switch protein FliM